MSYSQQPPGVARAGKRICRLAYVYMVSLAGALPTAGRAEVLALQVVPETVNSRDELEHAPALALSEALRITSVDLIVRGNPSGTYNMAVAADGMIAVLDGGTGMEVRTYDSMGVLLQTLRPPGGGDMHVFVHPQRIALARDSVVVLDRAPGTAPGRPVPWRIHIFRSDGEFLGTRQHEGGLLATIPIPNLFRATDAGWVLGKVMPLDREQFAMARSGPHHDTMHIAPVDPDDFEIVFDRTFAFPEMETHTGGPYQRLTPFMALRRTYAVGGDGRVYANATDGYHIDVWREDGTLQRRIRGAVERILVPQEEFERWAAGEAEGMPASLAAVLREHGRWVGHATYRPVLGRMLASRDGFVLVQRLDLEAAAASSDQAVWDVLDPDGRIAGRLVTDAYLRPDAFEWPFVYGAVRGTDGRVDLYRWRVVEP